MALSVSKDMQLALFKALFGATDPVTLSVASLIDQDAKVDVFGSGMD